MIVPTLPAQGPITMQIRYLFFLSLFLFSACIPSSRVVQPDREARLEQPDLAYLEATYGAVAGVFLSYEKTYEHDLKVDFTENQWRWKMYEVQERSWVVLDENKEMVQFELVLPRHARLKQYRLEIRQPDGSLSRLGRGDLEVMERGNDSLAYGLNYPAQLRGVSVLEQYEVEYADVIKHPPVAHDVSLQFSWPAEQVAFNYIFPESWDIQLKEVNQERVYNWEEVYLADKEAVLLSYQDNQVPRFTSVPYGPFFKEVAAYASLRVRALSVGNEIDWEGPATWEEVAANWSPYVFSLSENVPQAVEAHATRLTKDLNNTEKEIAAIMDFVRSRVEVEPRKNMTKGVAEVLNDRSGSAYEVTALAQALLHARGIPSQFLLGHSARSGHFDAGYYTDSEFLEPVLGVTVAETMHYLVPSRRLVPLGFIPDDLVGQPALRISEQGFGGFEDLRDSGDMTRSRDVVKITLNDAGQVVVQEQWFLGGRDAHRASKAYETPDGVDWDRLIADMQAYPVEMTTDRSVAILDRGEGWEPVHIQLSYVLTQGLIVGDGDVALQTARIAMRPVDRALPLKTDGQPLWIRSKEHYQKELLVDHPDQWSLLTVLSDMNMDYAFGDMTMTVSDNSGALKMDWSQTLQPATMTMEETLQLVDMLTAPASAMGSMLEMGMGTPALADENNLLDYDPVGPWTMVVSTERTRDEARKVLYQYHQKLYSKGYPVSMIESTGPDRGYRVIIGRFMSWSGVEMARTFLRSDLPYDSWVMKAPETWNGTADLEPPQTGPQH